MKTISLGTSGLQVPAVAVGCMRMIELDKPAATKFLQTALAAGANFFDHADIYGDGACESLFADAIGMSPSVRESIFLQSKCGIRKGVAYDFSKAHLLRGVDGILQRLRTEYLDVLLLHRPDTLMEPEVVAEVFDQLHASGKVRQFGVSNFNPIQIQFLQKYVKQPLVANQVQFGIGHASMISAELMVNRAEDAALMRDDGILSFCRLNDITIQPWSPFQGGLRPHKLVLDREAFPVLNAKIDEIAARYNVSDITIAIAWILRHPANMQPVVGTTKEARLLDCVRATEITLTREEWYEVYMAAGNMLP